MSKEETDETLGRHHAQRVSLHPALRWLLLPLILFGLALLWRSLPVSDWVELRLLPAIDRAGWWGYLVFVAVYVSAVVVMAPGTVLTLAGGYLYGPLLGAGLALFSAVTGASVAFLVSRRFARQAIRRRIEADRRFRSLDRAVAQRGAWVVLLLRLSPAVPFNVLNYALGLTGVRFTTYVLYSLVGMAPGTVVIAFIGASASDTRPANLGWGWWAILLLSALLTATVLAVIATRALALASAEAGNDSPLNPPTDPPRSP
ncbi:TVP38/TMEM64 family protein [Tautonia marina]|uniref:TVP38/TMEM64 family protein n=1 Tax=Tautonia marina TaxID=2653855 RepID=UPI001260C747|nr:TVP38/TMEM64 family protein [Tautonia marina]